MKLTLILGVAAVGFTAPALASQGQPAGVMAPTMAAPAYVRVAQNADPLEIVHEIFRRLRLPEGSDAVREAEYRGEAAEGMVDLEEENTEETFRCRFSQVLGAPVKCLISLP